MTRKNLFSKIIAGVLAAGMVVTMLPGISLTAKADGGKFYLGELSTIHATIQELDGSATYANILYDERIVDGTPGGKFEGGKDYLVVPDPYYEYTSTPSAPVSSALEATTTSALENRISFTRSEEYGGMAWIMHVPSGIKAGEWDLLLTDPQPIEVTLTVDVGENIEARQRNENPRQHQEDRFGNGKVDYVIYRTAEPLWGTGLGTEVKPAGAVKGSLTPDGLDETKITVDELFRQAAIGDAMKSDPWKDNINKIIAYNTDPKGDPTGDPVESMVATGVAPTDTAAQVEAKVDTEIANVVAPKVATYNGNVFYELMDASPATNGYKSYRLTNSEKNANGDALVQIVENGALNAEGKALLRSLLLGGVRKDKIVGFEDGTYWIKSGTMKGLPLNFKEDVPYDPTADPVTGAAATYKAATATAGAEYSIIGYEGITDESRQIYSSVLVIEATKNANTAGDIEMYVDHRDYFGEGAENSYKTSPIVDLINVAAIETPEWKGTAAGARNFTNAKTFPTFHGRDIDPFAGEFDGNWAALTGTRNSGKVDYTSYIGITRIDGKKLDGAESEYRTKNTGAAQLPARIDTSVQFTVDMPKLYNLYAGGWADPEQEHDDRKITRKPITAPANTAYTNPDGVNVQNPWLNRDTVSSRYGTYRHVTIKLGTGIAGNNQRIKIENAEELTYNRSVVSKYKFAAVIRRPDGTRWDLRDGDVRDYPSLMADPVEWPADVAELAYSDDKAELDQVRGYEFPRNGIAEVYNNTLYKEGDTFECKVLIDPMYQKGADFDVVYYEQDNLRGTGTKQPVAKSLTYNAETDTYSFEVGNKGPYRVYVQGLEPKATRKLNVIPQDGAIYEGEKHTEVGPLTNYFYQYAGFGSIAGLNDVAQFGVRAWEVKNCNYANPVLQWFIAADEEDTLYKDLVIFSRPRVVGGKIDSKNTEFVGHVWPQDYAVDVYPRFSDTFDNEGKLIETTDAAGNRISVHGTFDDDITNDRYAKGPDFKVLLNDTELKMNENGSYTIPAGTDDADLRFEGVVRAYHVYAPNVAAYDISANYNMNRNKEGNFVSSVPEGETYSFELKLSEGVSKGPNFKVELAQVDDASQKGDYMNSVVRTVIPENKDGKYEFTVKNDVEIIISGIIGGEGFSDIGTTTDEEQAAINWLKDQGILGFGDGTFRPGISTTRAEFVRMLYVLNKGTAGTANFSDTGSHWAAGEIGWGAGKQIIDGYPDGTFKPDQPIRRSEVAQIIWKMAGSQGTSFVAPFPDVNQGDWFAPAINWNFGKQIIQGYTNGNFGPNDPIKRAHIALMLYRANGQY